VRATARSCSNKGLVTKGNVHKKPQVLDNKELGVVFTASKNILGGGGGN